MRLDSSAQLPKSINRQRSLQNGRWGFLADHFTRSLQVGHITMRGVVSGSISLACKLSGKKGWLSTELLLLCSLCKLLVMLV